MTGLTHVTLVALLLWPGVRALGQEAPVAVPQVSRATFTGTLGLKAGREPASDLFYLRDGDGGFWFLGVRANMPPTATSALEQAVREQIRLEIRGEVTVHPDGTRILATQRPFEYRILDSKPKGTPEYSEVQAEPRGWPGRQLGPTPDQNRYGLLDDSGRVWFLGLGERLPKPFVDALDEAIGTGTPMRVAGWFLAFQDQTRALNPEKPFDYRPAASPQGDSGGGARLQTALIQGVPRLHGGKTAGQDIFLILDQDQVPWFLGKRSQLPGALLAALETATKDRRLMRLSGQVMLFEDGQRVLSLGHPYEFGDGGQAGP